ncbi:GIY-YIG nuclease family protein [Nocardia sp. CA-135398]|uniref:GIY-YIG nuclease family protein n=1 Tax=Nocardia sp. CA-135398 TaxID=3239977 RepID=UPI003D99E8F0
MLSGENLAEQRDEWIATVCEGLIGQQDEHPAFGAVETAPELGDPGLTRALLVARIAALIAGGRTIAATVEVLVDNKTSAAFQPQLTDLVMQIYRRMEWDGVVGSRQFNGGTRVWSPEDTYQLMLELWSARQLRSVSKEKLRRELVRRWGVDNPDWLGNSRTWQSDPLQNYPDVWATLRTEPNTRVGNLAALGLSNTVSNQAWDRWADRLSFSPIQAKHLYAIGGDLVRGTQARRVLRHTGEWGLELERHAPRALEVIENLLERISVAVGGLCALERELLVEHSYERHLQECCLATAANWSCRGIALRPWSSDDTYTVPGVWGDGTDAVHGMWGPLPWWVITVRHGDQERAAVATLNEGAVPLGVESDPGTPDRLTLVCRRPRTGAPGLRASFTFDMSNPAHACELLLIGRRGGICIDVIRVADYDSADLDDDNSKDLGPVELGTLRVEVGRELARFLTEFASKALKNVLPERWKPDGAGEIPALREALERCARLAEADCSSFMRRLLVTSQERTGRCIVLETDDPPAAMTGFASPKSKTKRSPEDSSQLLLPQRQGAGFVYVLRNQAIPGMLKIGYSHRLSEDRADDLFSTSVPFPFEVLYRAYTSRSRDVEQAVHRLLAAHRVAANREFFRVTSESAEEAIRFCQEIVTGIESWEPMPKVHSLHAGDRVVLPLKANQLFIVTAFPDVLAPTADFVDIWQAHSDGDLVELHLTDDPGKVHGLSDNDPDGAEDPVPYLNREKTAPNGWLHGRERLTAGDRLSWLSHPDAETARQVTFEICDPCQVTYRTWNPQSGPDGKPLLLNSVTRDPDEVSRVAFDDVLTLGAPSTWAPRNPDPAYWVLPAVLSTNPEDWLPQLRPSRTRGGPPAAAIDD